MKNTNEKLANIKSFILFFQKTISTKQSSTTNNPNIRRYLIKQRKIN